jgi:hypothetical protein
MVELLRLERPEDKPMVAIHLLEQVGALLRRRGVIGEGELAQPFPKHLSCRQETSERRRADDPGG